MGNDVKKHGLATGRILLFTLTLLSLGSGLTIGGLVDDGGFEAGPFGGFWNESSTNFGTPICDAGTCGTGGGSGPFAGSFWAWFGGISAFEEGRVSQSVTIPAGNSATMRLQLEMPVCSGMAGDFLEVRIGGVQMFVVDATDTACGVVGYSQQTVDLTSFANSTVTVEFHSISGNTGLTSNFFVDDVAILVTGFPGRYEGINSQGERIAVTVCPDGEGIEFWTANWTRVTHVGNWGQSTSCPASVCSIANDSFTCSRGAGCVSNIAPRATSTRRSRYAGRWSPSIDGTDCMAAARCPFRGPRAWSILTRSRRSGWPLPEATQP